MICVLIIFHSHGGNTEKMARAVAGGVEEIGDVRVILKRAFEAVADDLKSSDAVIFCSPEYFGYMAGAMKDFFDRTYEELKDEPAVYKKPYAIVISAGNDGSFAFQHIERICKGYRLKKVQNPVVCKGPVTDEKLSECFDLGRIIAEGLKAGVF